MKAPYLSDLAGQVGGHNQHEAPEEAIASPQQPQGIRTQWAGRPPCPAVPGLEVGLGWVHTCCPTPAHIHASGSQQIVQDSSWDLFPIFHSRNSSSPFCWGDSLSLGEVGGGLSTNKPHGCIRSYHGDLGVH